MLFFFRNMDPPQAATGASASSDATAAAATLATAATNMDPPQAPRGGTAAVGGPATTTMPTPTGGASRRRRAQLSEAAIRAATASDLTEEDGQVFLLGVPVRSLGYESCRVACNKYGCKGYSNLGVKEMRDAICEHKRKQGSSAAVYELDKTFLMEAQMCLDADTEGEEGASGPAAVQLSGKGKQPKLTTNSIFRAYNAFFHETMVEKLATLGDLATKDQLDRHHAGAPPRFFVEAAALYNDNSIQDLDELQHEHKMFVQAHLDPGNYEYADGAALKSVWDRVNKVYKQALENSKKSGSHADFSCFVKGRLDVLYLHLFLAARPNIADMVQAHLPPAAAVESSDLAEHLACSSAAAAATADAARASAADRGGKRKGDSSAFLATLTDVAKSIKVDTTTGRDQETEARKVDLLEAKLQLEQQRWAAEMRASAVVAQQQQLQLYDNALSMLEKQQSKLTAASSQEEKAIHQVSVNRLAAYCDDIMNTLAGAQVQQGGEGTG
eukprot:GHVU01100472.1.p1 GENE.GHVU01100472.1~~GHVU01100472.1.p1  ORF type:complete len:499 (-),score=94.92 GHVU01100472.1:1656-3152(-)